MSTDAKRRARDDKLVDWVESYLTKHKYAPTVREVGKAFGLSSTSTTSQWLQRLRREGRVDWNDGDTRTLHVKEIRVTVAPLDADGNPGERQRLRGVQSVEVE